MLSTLWFRFRRRRLSVSSPKAARTRAQRTTRLHLGSFEERLAPSVTPLTGTLGSVVPQRMMQPSARTIKAPVFVVPNQSSVPVGLQPAQVRHAYGIDSITLHGGVVGDGTNQTIAIVDAYDDPNIVGDLHAFDQQFGLSDPTFTKLNQNGQQGNYPAPGGGWTPEISLDVEWAHAIAPGANIVLVEANTANFSDIYTAVSTAATYSGVVAVSMSFGASEFSGENSYDSNFTTPHVTFVSASGDNSFVEYQAASPNVLGVGATTLTLTAQNNYVSEGGVSWSGGGLSQYESQPSYQNGVVTQSSTQRATPDVSFVGGTGVAVYDSYDYGTSTPWVALQGTSVSCPCWAGLIAIADQGRTTPLSGNTETLPLLYHLPPSDFHDITTGNNGNPAGPGYDLVTGIGTPVANLLVLDLAASTSTDTWTGTAADGKWSDAANWSTGQVPQNGNAVVFPSGVSSTTLTNDISGLSLASITFTGNNYTISGDDVSVDHAIDASNATGTNTLGLNVTLTNNTFVNVGGSGSSLTLTGTINDGGYNLIGGGGAGTITVSGIVSGSGGLTDNSAGSLVLTAANTYSGNTTLNSGTLTIQNASALGSGTLVLAGGTLKSNAAYTVANPMNLAASSTISGTSALTFSGAVTLLGNYTLTNSNTAGLTISGAIGQSGGSQTLTLAGNNKLTLSGTNTYSGGTVLSTGTLAVTNSSALGAGTLTLKGGTLVASGSAVTLANAVTVAGNPTLGNSTAALTLSGPMTLTASRTLTTGTKATVTISGAIGQSGQGYVLTVTGGGTLILTGNNSFARTVQASGTLAVSNSSAIGPGALALNGGTFAASGGPVTISNAVTVGGTVTVGNSSGALTFSGAVSLTGNRTVNTGSAANVTLSGVVGQSGGTYSLTVGGSGTLLLSNSNTYGGGTVLTVGTLQISSSASLGTGALTLKGGTLAGSSGPVTLTSAVTLGGNATLGGSNGLTFVGAMTLTGNRMLTVTDTGGVTVSGIIGQSGGTYSLTKAGSAMLTLSGANTFGGGLVLTAGTLALGNSSAAGTGTLSLKGGSLQASGGARSLSNAVSTSGSITINGSNSLTLAGAVTMTASTTLTVSNTATTTISGPIGQSASGYKLTKSGAGLLVLSGANTYTGGTTVSAGTLEVDGSLAAGTVSISKTATLEGSGSIGGLVSAASGSFVQPGNASSTGILTTTGMTLMSGSSLNISLNGTTAGSGYDQVVSNGTVNVSGATLALSTNFGGSPPNIGTVFTIVSNQSGSAVVGTFSGLAQGATITLNGMTFQISYTGGASGLDITLTRTA